jgi:chromosome segregation ATPase
MNTAEFEKVMVNIGFDPGLASFKGEYAKLLSALKASMATEKRLVGKIGSLNEEIVLNAGRVTQALRLAEEDGATIDDLRKQLERAWAMVEASKTREEASSQSSQALSAEAAQLRADLEKINEILAGDSIEALAASRDNLGSRLDTALGDLSSEKARGDGLVTELEARSQKLNQRRDEVRALKAEIALKTSEESKNARIVSALQADMTRLKEETESKVAEAAAARAAKADLEGAIARLQKSLEAQRGSTTAALAEAAEAANRVRRAEEELRSALERLAASGEAKAALDKELKEAKEATHRERTAGAKTAAKLEVAGKDLVAVKAARDAHAAELSKMRAELVTITKSYSSEQLVVREKERIAAKLDKEKAAAVERVARGEAALSEAELLSSQKDAEIAGLRAQIKELQQGAAKLRMVVGSLQRAVEQEKLSTEAAKTATAEALESLALKDAMVVELESREGDMMNKMRTMQAAFEAMRSERKAAQKSASTAQEEVAELQRKERIQANSIALLKDDAMLKDKWLVTEQFEVASLQKKINQRATECEKLRALLAEAGASVRLQGDELEKTVGLLKSSDEDSLAQKRAYDGLLVERDALATHLKSRNDELALARDKLAIMEVALGKGEKAYTAKEGETRTLKLKVGGGGMVFFCPSTTPPRTHRLTHACKTTPPPHPPFVWVPNRLPTFLESSSCHRPQPPGFHSLRARK